MNIIGNGRMILQGLKKKISYIKGFEPWQWAMGTGFYTNEVDSEIKELTRYNILIMAVLIIIICVLSLIILRRTFTNLRLIIEQEEELNQSLKLFRGMVTDSGLLIQENNRIIYANKKLSEIFENDFQETKEFDLSNFVVTDEKERITPFEVV